MASRGRKRVKLVNLPSKRSPLLHYVFIWGYTPEIIGFLKRPIPTGSPEYEGLDCKLGQRWIISDLWDHNNMYYAIKNVLWYDIFILILSYWNFSALKMYVWIKFTPFTNWLARSVQSVIAFKLDFIAYVRFETLEYMLKKTTHALITQERRVILFEYSHVVESQPHCHSKV